MSGSPEACPHTTGRGGTRLIRARLVESRATVFDLRRGGAVWAGRTTTISATTRTGLLVKADGEKKHLLRRHPGGRTTGQALPGLRTRAYNLLGADHHGYINRFGGALAGLRPVGTGTRMLGGSN